jgi:site-specific DNA-methyltransferase (adenine-specific)
MRINDQINIYNENNIELMATMPDESVDVICIDPPYLYLKGQKLERPFDELLFFSECKRLLTKNGFIVMFGRGTSFYRWNTILDELGFEFKEEIIWNKSYCSSPLMPLSRVHETISIHSLGCCINKVKVPYLEMKRYDINGIIQDIKRLKSILKNAKSLEAVELYLTNNNHHYTNTETFTKNSVTVDNKSAGDTDRAAKIISSIKNGMNEKSIINYGTVRKHKYSTSVQPSNLINENRNTSTVRIMDEGMNEKSIIKEIRDHYSAIHPTQKPVRLIERLLALTIKPKQETVVADFFAGSMSTMEACYNLGLKGIACEIDEEYFEKGKERLLKLNPVQKQLFEKTVKPMKTILTALLLFIASISFGQKDTARFFYPFFHQFVTKPVIEKQDVIIYSLQFLGGLADGMNQALVYHGALKGHPFWDYSTSWKRKYKDYDHGDLRAAFPGAKTWAVGITDGNHLTRGINRGASIISVGIAMSENKKWYQIVKKAIIASIINRIGFTLVYDHLLK